MNLRYGFSEYLVIQVLLYTCSFRVKSILFGSSVIVKLFLAGWRETPFSENSSASRWKGVPKIVSRGSLCENESF